MAVNDSVTGLAAEWPALLDALVADLAVLSRSTEDEFLAIGARLQEFYQEGAEVSGLATELVQEVAGDRVGYSMTEIALALDDMERYVQHAVTETEQSSQTLREILALLDRVAGPLAGFRKVNKVLRMLGISTKIESARLGQSAAGFDSLASDVGMLSVQVNDKANEILKRKDDLGRAIEQTLSGVLDSGARHQDRVVALLNKTRQSLDSLSSINARCSSSVAELSAVSDDISRSIGEVVMSMQFHDIVRQQMEHVEQALSELKLGVERGLAGPDEVACIGELQSAQLRNASQAFDGAVRTIMESLREVARMQSLLSDRTKEISGAADQAGGGFLHEMQRDLSVVSEALLESWKVNGSLSVAMASVSETVSEIAGFVGDIETIGEEIKLIALNAQIKSAYTGKEGAALGVLAEAIQRLSVDAIDQTGAVSEVLHSIIAVTERLADGGVADMAGLELEVESMVTRVSSLLAALREVNDTLRSSIERMDRSVTLLSAEIEEVVCGITVHETVSRALEQSVAGLAAVVGEARPLGASPGRRLDLDSLASRYTMQSERKVHDALLDPEPGVPVPGAGSDDGLGDNVELF